MGVTSQLRDLWAKASRTADKAKQLWRKAWKDSLSCFAPIGALARRRQHENANAADCSDPDARQDEHLVEDRPLLKHRHSAGFPARNGGAGARMQARAQALSNQMVLKSQVVSKQICAQAGSLSRSVQRNLPTPLRSRRSASMASQDSSRGDSEYSHAWEEISMSEEEEDIFEIGSDDEEEQAFLTRAVSLDECPPSFAGHHENGIRTHNAAAKVPSLGLLEFSATGKGRSDGTPCVQSTGSSAKQNVFYVGTPRDCD